MSPNSPPRGCREPGCPALVSKGRYCPTHARQYEADRGSPAERGYDHRHRQWRLRVLDEQPLCQDPDHRHPDEERPSVVADHIVPLVEWQRDPDAARRRLLRILAEDHPDLYTLGPWDTLNGQGLCVPCHNAKTARENRRPPASGRTQP